MPDTEPFDFQCQTCQQPLSATPDLIGVELQCPGCASPITVPNFAKPQTAPAALPGLPDAPQEAPPPSGKGNRKMSLAVAGGLGALAALVGAKLLIHSEQAPRAGNNEFGEIATSDSPETAQRDPEGADGAPSDSVIAAGAKELMGLDDAGGAKRGAVLVSSGGNGRIAGTRIYPVKFPSFPMAIYYHRDEFGDWLVATESMSQRGQSLPVHPQKLTPPPKSRTPESSSPAIHEQNQQASIPNTTETQPREPQLETKGEQAPPVPSAPAVGSQVEAVDSAEKDAHGTPSDSVISAGVALFRLNASGPPKRGQVLVSTGGDGRIAGTKIFPVKVSPNEMALYFHQDEFGDWFARGEGMKQNVPIDLPKGPSSVKGSSQPQATSVSPEETAKRLAEVDARIAQEKQRWTEANALINKLTNNRKTPVQEGTQAYYRCLEASKVMQAVEAGAAALKEEKARLEAAGAK